MCKTPEGVKGSFNVKKDDLEREKVEELKSQMDKPEL